jgi:hypothetical protein
MKAPMPLPREVTDALGNHYHQRPAGSEFYGGLELAVGVVKAINGYEARLSEIAGSGP